MTAFKSLMIIAAITVSALFLLSGCANNDVTERENKEKRIIQEYIKANNIPASTKTEGGIYFIEKVKGTGLVPEKDDYIYLRYTGMILEDTTIRETDDSARMDEWPALSHYDHYLFGPSKILYGYSMPGILEALSLMKEGGKARVIIPSAKANYDYIPLLYDLDLLKVIKNPANFDSTLVTEYLNKGFVADSIMSNNKIFVRIDENPAEIRRPLPKDTIYLHYEGYLLDGYSDSLKVDRVFDSNWNGEPVKVVYNGSSSKVVTGSILGFPAGLKTVLGYLPENAQATALLRYDVAFTSKGYLHTTFGYIIIPAFQSVIYKIRIDKIVTP